MSHSHSLSSERIASLLAVSKADPKLRDLHDVIAIITNTGMRLQELRQARWSDVHLTEGRIFIRAPRAHLRWVPINHDTVAVLKARRTDAPNSELVLGECPHRVLSRVSTQLRKIRSVIGVPELSLQLVRHNFFATLVKAGASATTLYALGGWKSPFSTFARAGMFFAPNREPQDPTTAKDAE